MTESSADAERVLLAVNGGLMRGMKVNDHMLAAGGTFVREAVTEPRYRLWSIDDNYPAMLRHDDGSGSSIAVEVWSLSPAGLVSLFAREPVELSIGWIIVDGGTRMLGVLGESAVVAGQREITQWGGWRAYTQAEGIAG